MHDPEKPAIAMRCDTNNRPHSGAGELVSFSPMRGASGTGLEGDGGETRPPQDMAFRSGARSPLSSAGMSPRLATIPSPDLPIAAQGR
jgi:hypothetical protein